MTDPCRAAESDLFSVRTSNPELIRINTLLNFPVDYKKDPQLAITSIQDVICRVNKSICSQEKFTAQELVAFHLAKFSAGCRLSVYLLSVVKPNIKCSTFDLKEESINILRNTCYDCLTYRESIKSPSSELYQSISQLYTKSNSNLATLLLTQAFHAAQQAQNEEVLERSLPFYTQAIDLLTESNLLQQDPENIIR